MTGRTGWKQSLVIAVTAAASMVTLAGCGGESFAERDPNGYKACSEWAGYVSRGDVTSMLGGSMAVAEIARTSSSKEIRKSVENLFDKATANETGQQFGMLDRKKFESACKHEGFNFD